MTNKMYYGSKDFYNYIKEKHIIPYRCDHGEMYKTNHFYYESSTEKIIKVKCIQYNDDNIAIGAIVEHNNGHCSFISETTNMNDYRLVRDTKLLYTRNIINDGQIYTGAEIVYWFFINEIDFFNRKFKGFAKFINPNSVYRINDNKKYTVTAELAPNGLYYYCKIAKV